VNSTDRMARALTQPLRGTTANDTSVPAVPTENLIHRAVPQQLKDVMFALLATHPELTEQVRALFRERPGSLSGSITTTARLAALQAGWLYRDPGANYWFRIVEIGPLIGEGNGYREATLEPALGNTSPPSAAASPATIVDCGEPFPVKIPRGRL